MKCLALATMMLLTPVQTDAQDGAAASDARIMTVAVLDLAGTGAGLTRPKLYQVAERLRRELGTVAPYRVLPHPNPGLRSQIRERVGADCRTGSCAAQTGRILGAELVVVGSVALTGGTFSVALKLVGIETGNILCSIVEERRCTFGQLLDDVTRDVAEELAGRHAEAAREAQRQATEGAVAESVVVELPPTVTVIATGGASVSPSDLAEGAAAFAEALSHGERFRVMGAVQRSLASDSAACSTESCAVEAGRAAGTDEVV